MDENEQDLFANLSEAFLDNNEDGKFNPATATCKGAGANSAECIAGQEEIFVDFNNNGKFDTNTNPAVYNGLLCPIEGNGVWCSRSLLNVRAATILILSADTDYAMELYRGRNRVSGTTWDGGDYTVYISDIYNNKPPEGSTVSIVAGGDCEVVGTGEVEVPNTASYGAFGVTFQTGGVGSTGSLEITLTPTDGTPFSRSFNCVPEPEAVDPNSPLGGVGP
jgi:hypothetical protein